MNDPTTGEKRKPFWLSLAFACFFLLPFAIGAQTYTDGPIQLQVKLREFQYSATAFNDASLNFSVFGVSPPSWISDDEVTFRIWARDNNVNFTWDPLGGTCNTQGFNLVPNLSADFNQLIFDFTYPTATVPQYFDIRIDAFEDDLPSDYSWISGLTACGSAGNACTYSVNVCCISFFGCLLTESDDAPCVANPYKTNLDYRLGPPCQWYNHGIQVGTGCAAVNNLYRPRIESYWRYTKGTACNNAIPLGNVFAGMGQINHFNSNECYSNNYNASPGNDVFYQINVTSPMGLKATLCSQAAFDTYLYLLDGSCNVLTSNDNFCGSTSEFSYPLCNLGTYYIVVDGATAPAMGTFTLSLLNDPSVIVNADAGPNTMTCLGASVLIGGSPPAFGGQPPYSYSWTDLAGSTATINAPTDSLTLVFPSVTTQYVLSVTDANNCIDRDTVIVLVNPGPTVNLGNDTTICPFTNITLNAGGPYVSYFWSTGGTSQTITVNYPDTFFVTVIDVLGCFGRDTIIVNNYPTTLPNLGPDTSICINASLTLNPGAYASYQWQPGLQVTPTITVNTAGQYSVMVTDANNCNLYDTIQVGIDPLPTPNLGPDQTICPGTYVTLNPGLYYIDYDWNTGDSIQNLPVTSPATYIATVRDTNGCVASDTMQLLNYPGVSPGFLGPDLGLCIGSGTTLNAGVYASYAWSTGAITPSIPINFPGTYSVTVTDNDGCTGADTITYNADTIPVVDLGPDTVVCYGNSLVLDAGNPGGSYSWTPGSQTTQTLTASASGTYSVTVTTGANCVASDQIEVTIAPLLTLNLGPDTSVCDNEPLFVDAGTGFAAYQWSGGTQDQFLVVSAADTVDLVATDIFGCDYYDTLGITLRVVPQVSLGPDTNFCPGGDPVTISASTGFDTYLWNTGATTPTIQVGAAGAYRVTATYFQCTSEDEMSLAEKCPADIESQNIFSPNGDGVNDTWGFYGNTINQVDSFDVKLFDRWGGLVYTSTNVHDQWNGKVKNNDAPVGVYYWVANYKLRNSLYPKKAAGNVTLVR